MSLKNVYHKYSNNVGAIVLKPKENHPWRSGWTPAVSKWAKEKSDITNVQTFAVGRLENLGRKDTSKMECGRQV